MQAAGIVVITRRGVMANLVTNCRPTNTPVFAFTNDGRTRRQLSLNRAVVPDRVAFSTDPEKTLMAAFEILKRQGHVEEGDKVVVISDVIAGPDVSSGYGVDAIQIRSID